MSGSLARRRLPATPHEPESTQKAPGQRPGGFVVCLAVAQGTYSVQITAAGVVHGYFNSRSLVVASHSDGPRYRIWGDRTMFTPGPDAAAGTARAAEAASASRRAISELLRRGGTGITSREIFESFPSHVDVDGVLLTLPEWHDARLRDLCFQEIFRRPGTQSARLLLTLFRRLGVPSPDYAAVDLS
jgi:hypothetical protein